MSENTDRSERMTGTPSKDRAEAHREMASALWDAATNAVCQTMQAADNCNCADGHCIAARVDMSKEDFEHFVSGLHRETEWRTDIDAAPELEIHNVVGRYREATAGFPRYAARVHGRWLEYSRREPEEIVVWAWRPRDDWPLEERR